MTEQLRLAELVSALSLATDLGMGQPLEQALRTCLIALELADRVGLGAAERSDVFYTALLRFLGCTADAHEFATMAGGDEIALRAAIAPVLGARPREFAAAVLPHVGAGRGRLQRAQLTASMLVSGKQRARAGAVAGCETAVTLAAQLHLGAGVRASLAAALEQWNGAGLPAGVAGDAIPLPARIVFVARDVEVLQRVGGVDHVVAAARSRRSRAYDPMVADAFLAGYDDVLRAADVTSPWEEVLQREPQPRALVPEGETDSMLQVFADFVDLKSPYTAGHSRQVAELVALADREQSAALRRAALVHDIGRTSVPNGIWEKPGALSDGEWERVRLHPYYSERIVGRVRALRPLATLAGQHHERLDGSGYHRGSARGEISAAARILAVADAYQAMTHVRPHRAALSAEQAAAELESTVAAGRLDRDAVAAVLDAAGHRRRLPKTRLPAGLTEREVDVLRLLCRGATKKVVARQLAVSPATVDHHVRHIYDKADVRSRAGATLFALNHGLLD